MNTPRLENEKSLQEEAVLRRARNLYLEAEADDTLQRGDRASIIKRWEEAGSLGYTLGYVRIGDYYRRGDLGNAIKYYRKGMGCVEGLSRLGLLFWMYPMECARCVEGSALGMRYIGMLYIKKAAYQGCRMAMLEYGRIVVDQKEKRMWFRRAMDRRSIEACYEIGVLEENQNCFMKAFEYFHKGYSLGHLKSSLKVAEYYHFGRHGEKDLMKALEIYSERCKESPDILYRLGTISVEVGLASERWFEKAASFGHDGALYMVGLRILNQRTAPDYTEEKKALIYFTKAAKLGNSDAMLMCGKFYEFGWGLMEFDLDVAEDYYIKASKRGNVKASLQLYKFYMANRSINIIPKNQVTRNEYFYPRKALKYLTLAADGFDPEAQFYLGKHFENGIYIEQSISKAIYYYESSAEQGNTNAMFAIVIIRLHESKYTEALRWAQMGASTNYWCRMIVNHLQIEAATAESKGIFTTYGIEQVEKALRNGAKILYFCPDQPNQHIHPLQDTTQLAMTLHKYVWPLKKLVFCISTFLPGTLIQFAKHCKSFNPRATIFTVGIFFICSQDGLELPGQGKEIAQMAHMLSCKYLHIVSDDTNLDVVDEISYELKKLCNETLKYFVLEDSRKTKHQRYGISNEM